MELNFKSILSAIAIGLIVAAISSFVGFLIRQLLLSDRKKLILHWALLAIVGISGFIVGYQIIQAYRGNILSIRQFLIILFALLVHWGLGSVVYFVTHLQYGKKLLLQGISHTIEVRRLYSALPGKNLRLNWRTFSSGVMFLLEQIEEQRGGGAVFYVGINGTGGAIASLIAGRFGDQHPLPVFVAITKGAHRNLDNFVLSLPSLPSEKGPHTILVVDSQVKTGKAMKKVVDILIEKYGAEARILKAVLAIVSTRGSVRNLRDIRKEYGGDFEHEDKYLPDYAAFIHENTQGITSIRLLQNIQ